MPTVAPVVGFVDQLGYFRCASCARKHDREWTYPVWADSAPHNCEPCDVCGRAATEPAR